MTKHFEVIVKEDGYHIKDNDTGKIYLEAGWDHDHALEMADVLNKICNDKE